MYATHAKKILATFLVLLVLLVASQTAAADDLLRWDALPSLPNDLGVAGPLVGVHNDALIVAGGANFDKPVWENKKVWRDKIYVLTRRNENAGEEKFTWHDGGTLPQPLAYVACVSTKEGVLCLGGSDGENVSDKVFLVQWDPKEAKIRIKKDFPPLPKPCVSGAATLIGDVVYLAGGQSGNSLATAMNNLWALDLSQEELAWEELPSLPGPARAFNITAAQHNGFYDAIYVIGGRRLTGQDPNNRDDVEFLGSVLEYVPKTRRWSQKANAPQPIVAGVGLAYGQSHLFILGGSDGSLYGRGEELRGKHPGFGEKAFAYHTITNTWTQAGKLPQNQVTTVAVRWGDAIIVASGEIEPRVRTPKIWRVTPQHSQRDFGALNYSVLIIYLLTMVAIGIFFARKNKNTDDYFRGGKKIPWWAAGCSIFATMLSSLTFTGIPSKAFAQDWVILVGNMMIPVVAVGAVFIVLPFFRRIDATSAYEYLERRFNYGIRLFGSGCFTLFHLFRMGVVMSLTGLALAAATPLTPVECVLLMGVLSILYCTLGGIEAVIWTDTAQTVVLLGGGLLAFVLLLLGTEGGLSGFVATASSADKFRVANFNWDLTSTQVALWVIILGGLGQQTSSYSSDQAVVQRYMTTSTQKLAARSIWTNAVLSVVATFLFFAIGTALFTYYTSYPGKLDPTISTDQIFPLFISREMPIGLAGLIVAGIFAAAQSTVSTSMNSTATSVVTDFLRPRNFCKTEKGYLRVAQGLTFLFGVIGTVIGLVFVDPSIKSLFDVFIKIIGLFLGVLGGVFMLGIFSRRANTFGATCGVALGVLVMFSLWKFTEVNGYIYTTCGITICVIVGLITSYCTPKPQQEIHSLTVYSLFAKNMQPE